MSVILVLYYYSKQVKILAPSFKVRDVGFGHEEQTIVIQCAIQTNSTTYTVK